MSDIVTLTAAVGFCLLVLCLVIVIFMRDQPQTVRTLERSHFLSTYGASVQRMVAESPIDRTEVIRLRQSFFWGRSRAIRFVRKWDPVPRAAAASFVAGIKGG